ILVLHAGPAPSKRHWPLNTLTWGIRKQGIIQELVFVLALPLSSIRSDLYRRMIELLVAARKDAGLTQAEVGERIGRRQTFVSKFELGERRLDVAEFVMVSRVIGADPHVIIRQAEEVQGS